MSDDKDPAKMSMRELRRDYVGLLQSLDPLRRLVKDVQASGGLKCQNCDDVGWYVGVSGEQQIQCEFCYTVPDSVFNRKHEGEPGPQIFLEG